MNMSYQEWISTKMSVSPWIIHTKERPRLRLFCFPFAGGGASAFRSWSGQLPASLEVCPIHLPGREGRWKEEPIAYLETLTPQLVSAILPALNVPFVFFGHSMGALISWNVTCFLRKSGYPLPKQLFVAAHRAPYLPNMREIKYALPDDELLAILERFGGTPRLVLEHTELMQLLLPIIRADFCLCETYHYTPEPPLDIPITALGGEHDDLVSREELLGWQAHTSSSYALQMFSGAHFFIQTQQQEVLSFLAQAVRSML